MRPTGALADPAPSFAYLPRIAAPYVRDRRPTAADVLARWTDTTTDPAHVRSAAQMVASEGVIATLFYRLATAPVDAARIGDPPLPDPERYAAMLEAFAQVTLERARELRERFEPHEEAFRARVRVIG